MTTDLQTRLERCERANRRLWAVFLLSSVAWSATLVAGIHAANDKAAQAASAPPDSLRLSELVIVDEKGVERVRLGAQLPDAIVNGKRRARGDRAAGVLLYDELGQERGGYVTFSPSGYVGLTLDNREDMVASFLAGPSGPAMLHFKTGRVVQLRRENDWIELRADETGARVNGVRSKVAASQTPPMSGEEMETWCAELKAEQHRNPAASATLWLDACKERALSAACEACFAVH